MAMEVLLFSSRVHNQEKGKRKRNQKGVLSPIPSRL